MSKPEEVDNRPADGEETREPERKRQGPSREFLNGIVAGVLCMALSAPGIYSGKMLYDLMKARKVGVAASSENAGGDSFADTVEKMQVIEEAIDDYYFYGDEVSPEDIHEGVYK